MLLMEKIFMSAIIPVAIIFSMIGLLDSSRILRQRLKNETWQSKVIFIVINIIVPVSLGYATSLAFQLMWLR